MPYEERRNAIKTNSPKMGNPGPGDKKKKKMKGIKAMDGKYYTTQAQVDKANRGYKRREKTTRGQGLTKEEKSKAVSKLKKVETAKMKYPGKQLKKDKYGNYVPL